MLSRDQSQLTLKIKDQDLSFGLPQTDMHSADIVATLSTKQAENDQLLTIPFVVSNDVFSVQSHLKLYQKEQDDLVEINSYIARMKAVDVAKNLPPGLLGETTKAWIKRGFKAGELTNMHFKMVKDLATTQTLKNHFSAQLNAMELLFNSDWDSLKQLNAHLTVNDKTIKVDVDNTHLYDFLLEDITVQILDLSQDQLDVEVLGKMNSQSEQLTAFLKRAPMGETVDEVLEQFTLTGRAEGEIDLVIPGYGLPSSKQYAIQPMVEYLISLRDDIRQFIDNGESLEFAIDNAASSQKDQWLLFDIQNKRNVNLIFPMMEWE